MGHLAFSQMLSGDLKDSGRKMLTRSELKVTGKKYRGFQIFEISVDRKGVVNGVRHIPTANELTSTPARIQATNLLSALEFEAGTHYPKFQRARVRVLFEREAEVVEPVNKSK